MALRLANRILYFLARSGAWYTPDELARRLTIPKNESHIFHKVLGFLADFGFVELDEQRHRCRVSEAVYV